ncbi:MAG: DUF4838 domain-containing protein [Clostridia bacterium]|nr:DUF4838 domain-containing protein [Clostridia bacterium]
MYTIYKVVANNVVDFAAEELKKYMRMMMPKCSEIDIVYNPSAKDGFRLGLMENFELDTSESDDLVLDDIIHIDTDSCGGVIAGSNPRSVLLAVYRYLTENGCRWLFPGIDGEFIPIADIKPVKYHKMADCRFRGQCNEGAEYQPNMIEAIDFTPKIGMNIFMMEFEIPKNYYDAYYNHICNRNNREPEPINADIVLQWKRQCEAEMSKRGLQFHDMGHGWTAESFGISSTDGWVADNRPDAIPEESREFVALVNGKRELFGGVALNTEFCMSNVKARELFVKYVTKYASEHKNVDYLHIWLSDGLYNQCECENCADKIPSDWYVILLNEIDASLTAAGLDTRVVFIAYHETVWAPAIERLKNCNRFSFMLAAIGRGYNESVSSEPCPVKLEPYKLNVKGSFPTKIEEYLAHADVWKKTNKCPSLVYEYHFWIHQYRDPGVLDFAKIIYDDVRGYKKRGYDGIIEDGSQRSFFPNGFLFYVYASTLFDNSVDFDALVEDYFSHAYGETWQDVVEFLRKIGKAFDMDYMQGKNSADEEKGKFYNPARTEELHYVKKITEEFLPILEKYKNMPKRPQTIAMRLMIKYLKYCNMLSGCMALKAVGADLEASEAFMAFCEEFGKYEIEIERYYDQYMMAMSINMIFNNLPVVLQFQYQ